MKSTDIIDDILLTLQDSPEISSKDDFHKMKNSILARYKEKDGPSHVAMIARYDELLAE